MKRQLFLALILIFAVGLLMAGTPRTYYQKCVVETAAGVYNESPDVTNTGNTTSPNYIVHATIVETGETLGTDLGTPVTSLRIVRLGNGGSVPYYTATMLQLGTFPTQWVAGQTVHMWVQHVATGDIAEWNLTIPTSTTVINILDPAQVIGPFYDEPVDTWTFNLQVNGPDGYAVTGPVAGVTDYLATIGPMADSLNTLVGVYTIADAPVGYHWAMNPIVVTEGMFAPPSRADYVYNAVIEFQLVEDTHTWTYNLQVNGPDGYAVAGPVAGVTDYLATDGPGDQVNGLLGEYTIAAPPAGQYWMVNPIVVTPDMFAAPGKTEYVYNATIEFVLGTYPTYTINVNGPDGYAVTGPANGTTDYTATDNNDNVNDLVGAYTIADPPAGYYWFANPINVAEIDFVNGVATIEFVLIQIPPQDTWTLNVQSLPGQGYAIYKDGNPCGEVTNHACTTMYAMELYGTYTLETAPAGFHWEPAQYVIDATSFAKYDWTATIIFELVPDCEPGFTFEVNAFDLTWYSSNGYVFAEPYATNTPAHLDPNDLGAEIWYENPAAMIPPMYLGVNTPYIFGACGNLPFVTGIYWVKHVDYDDNTWIPQYVDFFNITTSYEMDFLNYPTVPVELSSFTATLTAQNYVQLTWVSQTESQMMGYLVYRSTTNDQSTSVLIDQPMIAATNTSTAQTYTATDTDVQVGTTYYYWLEAVEYNASTYHGPVSVIVEGNVPPVLPEVTAMKNAYPNPFKANGSTNIEVSLKAGENGTVAIYNVLGQIVRTFTVNEGSHMINWNGKDSKGNTCGSGIYFYKLSTPSMNVTKKMVIVK